MPDLTPIEASLTIEFDRAFHIGTGRAEGPVNRTVRRTANGRPYVPASALKGALRETAERIVRRIDERAKTLEEPPEKFLGAQRRGDQAISEPCQAPRPQDMCQSRSPCVLCRLFGNTLTGRRLIVDDARPVDSPLLAAGSEDDMKRQRKSGEVETYTRVSVDRRRKGAKGNALFTSENARPTRLASRLSGQLRLTSIEDHPPAELILLASTLAATDQIGGGASAGRGRCRITVEEDRIRLGRGDDAKHYTLQTLVESFEPFANSLLFQ
jgi:CRISPR/Cas system CSM-associated protein Csm3 (group 7 of RAMP superfamily)